MILSAVFGFVSGILIASIFHLTLPFMFAFSLLGFIIYGYKFVIEDTHHRVLVLCALACIGAACGAGRIYISDLYARSTLEQFEGQKISAIGIVAAEPDLREKNTRLTITLGSVLVGDVAVSVQEKIILSVPSYPEFSYGDEVRVSTTLQQPENIESDDGRIFEYANYLRARGIWYVGAFPKVVFVSGGHGNIIKEKLFAVKHAFTNAVNRALPEPESSLLAGLLLGSKQGLGKELLDEFNRAGVSHIVVLSGYNIAIVAETVMVMLAFLPATAAFLVGSLGIVLFTMLAGAGASGLRAAIMVLVALYAKKTNREFIASRALGFAVVLMLAHNPSLLVFDPSFQLSVLATIGLIFVSPIISPYLSFVPERFGFREVVSSTIATQLTVLPFLIHSTGILSLVSLPANVLILGTIPLTMLLGFVTGLFGIFSMYLSFIPGIFAYALLWYQLTVVHVSANISFGTLTLPVFPFWIVISVYIMIFFGLYFLQKRIQKNTLKVNKKT